MNGYQYEEYVAKYLKRQGFSNIRVTKASGDYGADIVARKNLRKYAVQCKLYSNPVGLKAVQEVVGAKKHYGCKGAIVVTNNTFTKPAKTLAEENGVILIDNVRPRRFSNKNNKGLISSVIFLVGAITLFIFAVSSL